MTDFGRRVGGGDMLKAMYDPNEDGVIVSPQTQADMTKSVYDPNEDAVIAVAQTQADMTKAVYDPVLAALQALAAAHKTQHQNGGDDEIACTGLVGRINYVDRGDPSDLDFVVGDFTTDGDSHVLNLSGIVPAGATLVHFTFNIKDDALDSYIMFTKNGNSNTRVRMIGRTFAVNVTTDYEGFVACDANRYIQYKAAPVTFTDINVTIKGWFI